MKFDRDLNDEDCGPFRLRLRFSFLTNDEEIVTPKAYQHDTPPALI